MGFLINEYQWVALLVMVMMAAYTAFVAYRWTNIEVCGVCKHDHTSLFTIKNQPCPVMDMLEAYQPQS